MPLLLTPPLSKSDAQRALVLADILNVPFSAVLPPDEPLPRDVEVLRDGLLALRQPTATIDCRDGGAPFRFLLTQAALQPGRHVVFTGTPRLGERPHGPLFSALRSVPGLTLTEGAPWPVTVRSPASFQGPLALSITGVESSQYASSLLLGVARLAAAGVTASLQVSGAMTSEGYFALTRRWVQRAGFQVATASSLTLTLSPSGERESFPNVPGDWSSLGYLLALSWVSDLPVARLAYDTGHPDEAIVTHLRSVGLTVTDRLAGTPTRSLDVDSETCPDAIPTLAVLATRLPQPSTFHRVGVLRHKESDRLAAIRRLVPHTTLAQETLTITPGPIAALRFDAHDDHRMAMSAAVLARLHGVPLALRGMDAVSKSFPTFWTEAAKAGVRVEPWP